MLPIIYALLLKESVQVKSPPLVLRDRVFLAVLSKEEEAPVLRSVDVDHAGGRPYPVVFGQGSPVGTEDLPVLPVPDLARPLHP